MSQRIIDESLDRIIFVDFYEGSYGPSVMLNVPSEPLLGSLKGIFKVLSLKDPQSLHLEGCDFVRLNGIETFRLHNDTARASFKVSISRGRARLDWNQPPSQWAYTSELVDRLTPCSHQYLTREGMDDALVILSFKEGMVDPGPRNEGRET
jgi:hypothetical protein